MSKMNLSSLIESYMTTSRLSKATIKIYHRELIEFKIFLSLQLNCNTEEIYLDKIYRVVDRSDNLIRYKPIDAKVIDFYLVSMVPKGYSKLAKSCNALKSFFRYYSETYNYADIVSKLQFNLSDFKTSKKPRRIFSRHEVLKLLQSMIKNSENLQRDLLLFTLLLSTGSRITEVLSLQVKHIDWDNEVLLLEKTKSKKQRVLVLRSGYGIILKQYCEELKLSVEDFLFQEDGKCLKRNDVDAILKQHINKANLPSVNIHSLRHSFGTFMYDAGSEITTVQQLLGHESLLTTLIYVHPYYTRNFNIKIKENDQVYENIKGLLQKYL